MNQKGFFVKLSIIVPCYNSTNTIEELVDLSIRELDQLPLDDYEFILVNDFSVNPQTIQTLRHLAEQYPFVKVLDLAKNFGQANAKMAALNFADGDYILNMDDDMQTHPESIPALFNKINEGYDLVLARYPEKKHSPFRNLLTRANKRFDEALLEQPRNIDFTSFWIARKFVRDELVRYHHPYSSMEGLFLRSIRRIANVTVDHYEREEGKSGYNLKKLVQLWSNFTNFTVLPLRIAGIAGVISALCGFIYMIVIIIQKIINPPMPAGYASLICVILLFFGITLICMGIIGEYVGRMFICVNGAPQFVVRNAWNLSDSNIRQAMDNGAVRPPMTEMFHTQDPVCHASAEQAASTQNGSEKYSSSGSSDRNEAER